MSIFDVFRRLRPPKDRSLARLLAWDPVNEKALNVCTGERWELEAYAMRMNRDYREYRVRALDGQGMAVFVIVTKERNGGAPDFIIEKTMAPRIWLSAIEAGGALAAFEHQHPETEGKFVVRPAFIRYTQ